MFTKILICFFLMGIVTARQAPACEVNEKFETCGTACPLTCQNKDDEAVPCEEICVEGCFCEEGYVRSSENGICVPQDSCESSAQCETNEEYSDCATLCPLTCDGSGPEECPEICLYGCVCSEGFIRSTIDGPCVSKDTCSTSI